MEAITFIGRIASIFTIVLIDILIVIKCIYTVSRDEDPIWVKLSLFYIGMNIFGLLCWFAMSWMV